MSPLRSLRLRLVTAFVLTTATLLALMGSVVYRFQGLSETLAMITEGYLPLKEIVGRLDRDQQRVQNDLQRTVRAELSPGTLVPFVVYTDALKDDLEEARIHARQAQAMARTTTDQAALGKLLVQLDRIEGAFRSYQDHSAPIREALGTTAPEQRAALVAPLQKDEARLREELETLTHLVDGRIESLAAESEASRIRQTWITALLTAGGLLLSLAATAATLSGLRPIGQLTAGVQRLASGDYSGQVKVDSDDEIGLLAQRFNEMLQALKVRDQALVERADELNRLTLYLGSVLDSLKDGLFVVEGGVVTLSNPAATQRWEVRVGEPAPDYLLEVLDRTQPVLRATLHRGRGIDEVRGVPFGIDGTVVVLADVTEETRALERLARSERLALVGQMLAQITHEVRNPLNALSLNVDLLQEELEGLDPTKRTEAGPLLHTVKREIGRLTAVTGHYLQLARRPRPRLSPEPIAPLVREIARLLDAELAQKGVGLSLALEEIPEQLVDGNQLRQALINVVRNAAESGARRVEVGLRLADGEILLAVSDDGPGMDPEDLERAFDPFYSTKATGTGLGLAITRQILEDHDGVVRVTTGAGRGTVVVLAFPARAAPEPADVEPDRPGR